MENPEFQLKQGKGSFEITVGDEQTRYYSGYFACMIRTEGSDFLISYHLRLPQRILLLSMI